MPLWFKVRIRSLRLATLDIILIFIYLSKILIKDDNFSLNQVLIFTVFTILWILSSYISGRLSKRKEKSQIRKIFALFRDTVKNFVICYFVLNIYLNFKGFDLIKALDLESNFLNYLLSLSLSSFIIFLVVDLLFNNYKISKKNILIVGGEKKIIELIKKYTISSESISKYKFYESHDLNKNTAIDEVLVINSKNLNHEESDLCKRLMMDGLSIKTPTSWFAKEFLIIPSQILKIEDFYNNKWILDENINSLSLRIKRFGDIVLSLIIIFITVPLVLFAAIFIFLEDRGPILYSQKRIGKLGEVINIYKLRTMCVEAEKGGIMWSVKGDNRVTMTGRVLRKTRIDELPQLLSVIKGEMSLIGPRPERGELEEIIEKHIPYYYLRRLVKPGLSGWAQVNYPYGASLEDTRMKLGYDLFYIKNYSFGLDFLILLKTIRMVFNASGSTPK